MATIGVGSGPQGIEYDPIRGWVYVTNTGSNSVTILNGTSTVATVGVGGYPSGVAYDARNHLVYVSDYTSNSVTVLDGTIVIAANLPVSTNPNSGPYAVAYSPATGWIYVAEYHTSTVAVINGTTVIANVTVPFGPDALAYDVANSEMYVASNGPVSSSVSALRGTTVVGTVSVGSQPEGIAYDPAEQLVYVTNVGSNTVSVINSTNQVATTIPVGDQPVGIAFDPANDYLYVAEFASRNLTVINGTTPIALIATAATPIGVVFDAQNGGVYVTQQSPNTVLVISTELVVGPVTPLPGGTPAHSADVGQSVEFTASVWYLGSGSLTALASESPTDGLGCAAQVAFTFSSSIGGLAWACRPMNASGYSVALGVSIGGGLTVTSRLWFVVYPLPVAPVPSVSVGIHGSLTQVDVGQVVNISESASLGSGAYVAFAWLTFPLGMCTQTASARPVCVFTHEYTTPFGIRVIVTDSNGVSVASPSVFLSVLLPPQVSTPSVSRPSVDIGQPVDFVTAVTRDPTVLTFAWDGLPGGCVGSQTVAPHCVPTAAGTFVVSVMVSDASGANSSRTESVALSVVSDPKLTAVTASPSQLTVGDRLVLTTSVSGGAGNSTINWSGLPVGCAGHSTTIACRPFEAGSFDISATATDSNGYEVGSTNLTLLVLSPPAAAEPGILGLPPTTFYGLIGGLLIAGLLVVAVVGLIVRRR